MEPRGLARHPLGNISLVGISPGFSLTSKYLIDRETNLLEAVCTRHKKKGNQIQCHVLRQIDFKISGENLVGFDCLRTRERLLIAYETGDIFIMDHRTRTIERSDQFDKTPLLAVSVSPSNDSVVFITKDNTLILTDSSLKTKHESKMSVPSKRKKRANNKRQAAGSSTENGAKNEVNIRPHPRDIESDESGRSVVIVWLSGSEFAVSFWDLYDRRRKIQIYGHDGRIRCVIDGIHCLDSVIVSEPHYHAVHNYDQLCDGRPSSLIVATRTDYNRDDQELIFLSQTGILSHGIRLLYGPEQIAVIDIQWPFPSLLLILAYQVSEKSSTLPGDQLILIYRRDKNGLWSLIQHIPFLYSRRILKILVDPPSGEDDLKGGMIHTIHHDGSYRTHRWRDPLSLITRPRCSLTESIAVNSNEKNVTRFRESINR